MKKQNNIESRRLEAQIEDLEVNEAQSAAVKGGPTPSISEVVVTKDLDCAGQTVRIQFRSTTDSSL